MTFPVKVITPVPETVRSLISVLPVPTAPILVVEVPASRITSVAEPPAVPIISPTDIAPVSYTHLTLPTIVDV